MDLDNKSIINTRSEPIDEVINTGSEVVTKMMDYIRTEQCNVRDIRDNMAPLKPQIHRRKEQPCQQQQQQQQQPQLITGSVDEVDNQEYRIEEVRLRTYANWPVPFMDPGRLAAAGFYYTGEDDKVRCFVCKVEVCQWVEGDNPMAEHQRWQGQCAFMRKIPCGNVPIGVDPSTVPAAPPRSIDVCGPYGIEYRVGSTADCHSAESAEYQLPSTAKLGSLGIGRPTKGPSHPQYASYDARLRSFDSWPKAIPQTKESLVDAGFYYTGKADQTLCYHCGGGLRDWEPKDDPWEQHATWFSKCYYLLMVKGQAYVNEVTGQSMPPPSREETMQMNLPSYIKKVEAPKPTEESMDVEANETSVAGPSSSPGDLVELASAPQAEKPATSSAVAAPSPAVNKVIDDARMCKICYGEELGVVFLPCGHMVACVKCAPGMTSCALCRQPVSMTVRAFFS